MFMFASHNSLTGELLLAPAPLEQIATVGVYGAKKVVTYAKAFIKARKDSAAEGTTEDGSAVVASGDAGEGGEEQAEAEVSLAKLQRTRVSQHFGIFCNPVL